jgi:hypothetical protein
VRKLTVADRIAQLHPDTAPKSIALVLARHRPAVVQFSEPLPERVLAATAAALADLPEIRLRAYGRALDPSLDWLKPFSQVRELAIDLWNVTSFEPLAVFHDLRRLSLGETASKRPSLAFLKDLPELEALYVEAHDRDFAAIAEVKTLKELHLRVPRVQALDSLRGHPRLAVVSIAFGAIRDLRPLADIPGLRALDLYQVRKLDTNDLEALGDCRSLFALSLGALRNVRRLSALARSPKDTLRYLTLERMSGLETLAELAECAVLEQIYLVDSKPRDGRLDLLARSCSLRHLIVGDHYSKEQIEAADSAFAGETLWVHGKSLRGDPERSNVEVRWRRPVGEYLTLGGSDSAPAHTKPSG